MESQHITIGDLLTMWSIPWLTVIVLMVIAYTFLTRYYHNRSTEERLVKTHKKVYFYCGLFFLFLSYGSPLATSGHYLFSAHMMQMALNYLVVPPLLLAGTPAWFIRPLFRQRLFQKVLSFFVRPLISLVLFNFLFTMYHLPTIFDTVIDQPFLHFVYHGVLLFTAFCMWWLVFCPLPEYDHLSEIKKIGYIFANGVLLTPACALIIFATTPLYTFYMEVPQVISGFPQIDDQRLGGVLMKAIQEVIYIGAIGYIFYQWIQKEKKEEIDPLQTSARSKLAFSLREDRTKV